MSSARGWKGLSPSRRAREFRRGILQWKSGDWNPRKIDRVESIMGRATSFEMEKIILVYRGHRFYAPAKRITAVQITTPPASALSAEYQRFFKILASFGKSKRRGFKLHAWKSAVSFIEIYGPSFFLAMESWIRGLFVWLAADRGPVEVYSMPSFPFVPTEDAIVALKVKFFIVYS